MLALYNLFMQLFEKLLLPVSQLFSTKMKLFIKGRKTVFDTLAEHFDTEDRVIWMHAASLGEYEQGVPVLERIKTTFPDHKILLTFFSPSGYEVKKNNEYAHCTTYLPLDTKKNAKRFLATVSLDLSIFVKYEIWPNFLNELKAQAIPTLLISGVFRAQQPYFKSYASFMQKALDNFEHLFVQNASSKQILHNNGFERVTISGDTRFDRVSRQLNMDNQLDFVAEFKADKCCIVCGSTWPADEALLLDYLQKAPETVKFIIAPHQIKSDKIEAFRKKLNKASVLFSEKKGKDLASFPILIIDTVGLLSKVYAYADIAYVGGAAGKTGLHNILEPAVFKLPIVIGKNHKRFPEAGMLQREKALFSVENPQQCTKILKRLVTDENYREEAGNNAGEFIKDHQGATEIIMGYLKRHHANLSQK